MNSTLHLRFYPIQLFYVKLGKHHWYHPFREEVRGMLLSTLCTNKGSLSPKVLFLLRSHLLKMSKAAEDPGHEYCSSDPWEYESTRMWAGLPALHFLRAHIYYWLDKWLGQSHICYPTCVCTYCKRFINSGCSLAVIGVRHAYLMKERMNTWTHGWMNEQTSIYWVTIMHHLHYLM